MTLKKAFRQYNPSKPHRYELLLNSLNTSSFCINLTENHVCYLFNKTESNAMLQGQNIQMDSLHTSTALANWFLSRNIT